MGSSISAADALNSESSPEANEEELNSDNLTETPEDLGDDQETEIQEELEEDSEEDGNTPFHKHPRFKEAIEQKNSALARAEKAEQAIELILEKFPELKEKLGSQGDLNTTQQSENKGAFDIDKYLPEMPDFQFKENYSSTKEFGKDIMRYMFQAMDFIGGKNRESQTKAEEAAWNTVAQIKQSFGKDTKSYEEFAEFAQYLIKKNDKLSLYDAYDIYLEKLYKGEDAPKKPANSKLNQGVNKRTTPAGSGKKGPSREQIVNLDFNELAAMGLGNN